MMTKAFVLAGLLLAIAPPVPAETFHCQTGCRTEYQLTSVSDAHRYGILIAAPEAGCQHVRFRVEGGGRFLGQTPPLGPGELAVVRLGIGFATGETRLLIAPVGCNHPPAAALRVVLAKVAPDHGWRASRELTLR